MDHLIALLDPAHDQAVTDLVGELADALAIDVTCVAHGPPHVTLVSYTGLAPGAAAAALAPVARELDPVSVRAHGYGVFAGDAYNELSLHVMVVRTRPLDELHRRAHAALAAAGACPDGTTDPRVWTPHITLLDRGLTPALLGRAVEVLARRPHRSWTVEVATLAVARGVAGRGRRAGVGSPRPHRLRLGAG